MPLDTLQTATSTQLHPSSSLLVTPRIHKPEVRPATDVSRTDIDGLSKDLNIVDGVRILDDLAPLERARLYHHTQSSRLEVLNTWEGAVISIDRQAQTFTARLYDLTNNTRDVSEAEFAIEDVSANDIDLLKVGGVFRWMIGYRKHSFGQRERISAIKFRRLPAWTFDDIKSAAAEGERLAGKLRVK
jgi:hypothetical protein